MNKRHNTITEDQLRHKVLIIGKNDWGDISSVKNPENAIIETILFPAKYKDLKRLKDYTLIILDYSPFIYHGSLESQQQNIFDKLLVEALDTGSTFCFLHYDEIVPEYDRYAIDTGYMREKDIESCVESQLGFRWLNYFSIKPKRLQQPIVIDKIHQGVFRPFINKWGASHNYFLTYGDDEFDDVIYGEPKHPVGFTINVRNGRIIFLPFQRDFSRKEDLLDGFYTLVDCLLTYITKSLIGLPEWAKEPYFQDEKAIYVECEELETKLSEKRDLLEPCNFAKQLLCQGEYDLEKNVPRFIRECLEISTERTEEFKEDFWILSESGERIAIGEVKSYVKGFKRSGIYSLYSHREANKLNENFPGILVTNNFLQAGSWGKKDRPIDKQHYEVAAQNNILILRIEDLVRLWDAYRNKVVTREQALSYLTKSKGWLKVDVDLKLEVFE
jgi:hypothetical protein